jgi:hypothetical protein
MLGAILYRVTPAITLDVGCSHLKDCPNTLPFFGAQVEDETYLDPDPCRGGAVYLRFMIIYNRVVAF